MCDNGIGIKEEDKNKLFKLFGFLESTQEVNAKGIGLGLYICKKIVEKFGGLICCQSSPMLGSKFSFNFCLENKKNKENTSVVRHMNPKIVS